MFTVSAICRSLGARLSTVVFFLSLLLVLAATVSAADTTPEDRVKRIFRLNYLHSIDGRTTGVVFGAINALYIDDEADELYVLDGGNRRVVITQLDGIPLYSFPLLGGGESDVTDIALDADGNVLVSGSRDIAVYDYKGKYKGLLEISGVPAADDLFIQSIAVDGDGLIHIGTSGADARIITLDPSGKFISQVEGKGKFINVRGLDARGDFTFLDSGGFRVLRINREGKVMLAFGRISSLLGGFSMPSDLAVGKASDRIYVVDANRFQAIVYDSEGKPLWEFGGSRLFRWPRRIAVDDDDRVYVADGTNQVRVFEIVEIVEEVQPVVETKVEEAPQAEDEVEKMVEEEARLLPVYFDLDSAELDDEDREVLDKDAEWLKKNPDIKINVQGYADERGSDEYNLGLSERRAKAVMDYFIEEASIDPSRLKVVPYGRVMTMEKTEEAMAKSRRVDFLVVAE